MHYTLCDQVALICDLYVTVLIRRVLSQQDRLQSLVFGLLRQRKLDFLDIYSEEIIQAAKGIVRQVCSPRFGSPRNAQNEEERFHRVNTRKYRERDD